MIDLVKILSDHQMWLMGMDGKMADLRDASLKGANLDGANLSGADLRGADLRGAYLRGVKFGGAALTGANLRGAYLSGADLSGADLRGANLSGAYLIGADLSGADFRDANLKGADLGEANFSGAILPTGETFEQYISEVVPALLTSGGKSLSEVLETGCWDNHKWLNCPMHVAFGITKPNDGPLLLRSRIGEFVHFFDAGLLPEPVQYEESGK